MASSSIKGSGQVAAPGALAAIATTTAPLVAGQQYRAKITVIIQGSSGPGDFNNVRMAGPLPGFNPIPVVPGIPTQLEWVETAVTSTALSVNAIAAATAGTVYSATVDCRLIADWEGDAS